MDYEVIDAPKNYVDFQNISNPFDDDGADEWFDNRNEDTFDDDFLPSLKSSCEDNTENKPPASSLEGTSPLLSISVPLPSDNGQELPQMERKDMPVDRETFLIAKGNTPVRGCQKGYHSPRPQPQPMVVEPPVVNTVVSDTKRDSEPLVMTEVKIEPMVEVKQVQKSPSSADSKKDVPIIKQQASSFKARDKGHRAAAQKAVACIHSLLSPRPRTKKTTPTKPEEEMVVESTTMEHVQEKKVSTKKTHEELQLEEMKRLQNLTRKRLRASRKSFARLAKTSGPVQVKGKLPTTETVEFHFHQTSREKKGMVVKGNKGESAANTHKFVNSLRSSRSIDNFNPNMTSNTKPPTPPGATVVKPFKFHLDNRFSSKSMASSDGPVVPAAEFVAKYEKATPPRFRRTTKRSSSVPRNVSRKRVASLTLPRTPVLLTKTRSRHSSIKSTAALEKEELEKIKQHKFKANPVNPAVFEQGGLLGVPPKIPQRSLIPPATPELATKQRYLERREKDPEPESEENSTRFTAKPMPDFSKVTGLPPKNKIHITDPTSPALTLKRRRLHDEEEGGNDEAKKARSESGYNFKANPVPDFEHVFKPQHEEKAPVKVEPFSFIERDKDKPTRESFVEMILRKSQPTPFKAQAVPDFNSGPIVPPKKELLPTKVQPFNLQSVVRSNKYATDWKEKLDKEQAEAKVAKEFKASDANVLTEKPFIPHQSMKPLTNVEEFTLNTELRSSQRAAFDEKLQKEAKRMEEENLQRKALHEIQEKTELKEYRKKLVHKAGPVKHYSRVNVVQSEKTLTTPVSPHLHTDKRLKSVANAN